ncbi:hypothetical protein B5M44_25305 [Shinella sumterensis]|uniref:hypothetical protein n=1 Tax=Shinella sumterensis TaxID=1967501 RepID=UPI00106E3350|nr:hypothetical protein [Shinella sumterensis]MCD1262809.1 hypothetical protein [Shinella sumterensis]TFE93272.1 hypothetical protein B5M44_25305 [Shinella sumterensis]
MATERDISLNDYLRARKIDPALATLVEHIAKSAIVMADHLKAAAFHDQIGNAGTRNVQDEEQKLLDVLADRVFRETCAEAASLAAYVSEEVDDVAWLKAPLAGDLILYVDPLIYLSNEQIRASPPRGQSADGRAWSGRYGQVGYRAGTSAPARR